MSDIKDRLRAFYDSMNNPPSPELPEGAEVVLEAAQEILVLTELRELWKDAWHALDEDNRKLEKRINDLEVRLGDALKALDRKSGEAGRLDERIKELEAARDKKHSAIVAALEAFGRHDDADAMSALECGLSK